MRLFELCDIHSGFTARGKLEPLAMGGVPALQLRDIDPSRETLGATTQRYDLGALSDRHFVSGGEVLFRSRGEPNTAVAVGESMPEPTAVIVPLMIMRPYTDLVLPEYLAWAINQSDAQRRLGTEAQGTGLRMVPMAALENLDIPLPNLPAQKRIVELNALARQEGRLLRQLAARREELVSAILGEAAKAADQKEIA